ncbi:MAG TPA: class I SAM-dependent methyltransferase [Bacteroidia bacterium]|jgi:SAM-dependent methyltransferase|nr:class I SAM-dependent methyltransferase [Bacteroidia bacterium]
MNNTEASFRDKWENNQDLAFSETLREGSDIQNWILNRNGWNTKNDLVQFLTNKQNILDAGCGNGRVTALLGQCANAKASVVGIDLVAADVAVKNLTDYSNIKIFPADLLENNSKFGKFDFIYCQEVLHHTNNPELSFKNLIENNLEDNGCIAIYVYRKKAPVREYVDDYIRDKIKGLSYAEAKKACNEITELGKALSDMKLNVKIPAVDILKIEAGEYDLQRFIYHYFMKCFWSNSMSFNNNSAINYDWYHPQNCERYEIEEIRAWFNNCNLKITHEFVDHYGITMHGKKNNKSHNY